MPGECLGVIGPNGAGKTTTIRICLGLAGPDAGDDRGLRPAAAGRRCARRRSGSASSPSSTASIPTSPAPRTCASTAPTSACRAPTIDERVPKLLEFAALQSKADAKPGELSGGMKRRLSLGRALVNDPDLLLLDEPTTGLDPQARHLMWERLQNLLQQGKAILLTTHFMDEAERLCDRLIVLDHGRKIAEGTPRKLIAEHLESDVVEVYGDGAAAAGDGARGARRARRDQRRDRLLLPAQRQAAARRAGRRPRHPLPAPPGQPRRPVPQADRPADPRRRLSRPCSISFYAPRTSRAASGRW